MSLTDRSKATTSTDDSARDDGFTLIEVLVVIVILGIVTAIVVMSVGGASGDAQSATCKAEVRVLANAAESYFARFDTDFIPDAGGAEGYEQTLVDSQVLRGRSTFYDLDANGDLVQVVGSACTV